MSVAPVRARRTDAPPRGRHRRVEVIAACLVLCLSGDTDAHASGEPEGSFVYENFAQAASILERAIEAHGGSALLDRALDIRLSFTGTYRYQAHYARPWAVRDYRMAGTWVYSARQGAVQTLATYDHDRPLPSFTILGTRNGITMDAGASRPDTIPSEELDARWRSEFEFLPHEFLRQARDARAGLRLLTGTDAYDVLHYTRDDGENRALYLDPDTHLLVRVERIDHWTRKGDRLEWRTFEEYVERAGMRIPLRTSSHAEGSSTQTDITLTITDLELEDPVPWETFTIPPEYRDDLEHWVLEPPAGEPEPLLPFRDIGGGVTVIDLPGSDARSLLVAFQDFSVVVEAGDHSDAGDAVLTTAAHVLPDKPVRFVVTSHHHPLYANGLRPYVQRGVTILTTSGNVDYYRDLATRPYRIRPDDQERDPGTATIEVVDGRRVLEDATQRIELHVLDDSDHVDEFILAYVPSAKLVMTGDLVYIPREGEVRAAGSRARAVHRAITERELDVAWIVQTWFLTRTDALAPYATLDAMVEQAVERDAAP